MWTRSPARHLSAVVAAHDAVEDPVTTLAVAAVPAFAVTTLLLWLLDALGVARRRAREPRH
jgi:hypothetical protein